MASYATWKDVPTGLQNILDDLKSRYMALTGYQVSVPDWALLNAASYGISNMADLGSYMVQVWNFGQGKGTANTASTAYPWADHGLTKDAYAALSTTYGTEYKKLTGQDLSATGLADAFTKVKDPTGNGFLSGSQYAQQLQQDQSMKDTFGWLKYGMDYSQFQQHKQAMGAAYGGTPSDATAVQALQYWHQNASATAEVRQAATNAPGKQGGGPTPGDTSSVIR